MTEVKSEVSKANESGVNRDNMRAWVAALRSGEFKQTKGKLVQFDIDYNKVGHCCLGVAVEVAIKAGVKHPESWSLGSTLPFQTRRWLGLDTTNPTLTDEEVKFDCECGMTVDGVPCAAARSVTAPLATTANDTVGWTFDQIATAVETYYGLVDAASA